MRYLNEYQLFVFVVSYTCRGSRAERQHRHSNYITWRPYRVYGGLISQTRGLHGPAVFSVCQGGVYTRPPAPQTGLIPRNWETQGHSFYYIMFTCSKIISQICRQPENKWKSTEKLVKKVILRYARHRF